MWNNTLLASDQRTPVYVRYQLITTATRAVADRSERHVGARPAAQNVRVHGPSARLLSARVSVELAGFERLTESSCRTL